MGKGGRKVARLFIMFNFGCILVLCFCLCYIGLHVSLRLSWLVVWTGFGSTSSGLEIGDTRVRFGKPCSVRC